MEKFLRAHRAANRFEEIHEREGWAVRQSKDDVSFFPDLISGRQVSFQLMGEDGKLNAHIGILREAPNQNFSGKFVLEGQEGQFHVDELATMAVAPKGQEETSRVPGQAPAEPPVLSPHVRVEPAPLGQLRPSYHSAPAPVLSPHVRVEPAPLGALRPSFHSAAPVTSWSPITAPGFGSGLLSWQPGR
jgi:hypothetical protein